MSRLVFEEERCKGCLLCTTVCPKKLLRKSTRFNRQGYNIVEAPLVSECTACASCALICPDCAINVIRSARGAAHA